MNNLNTEDENLININTNDKIDEIKIEINDLLKEAEDKIYLIKYKLTILQRFINEMQ